MEKKSVLGFIFWRFFDEIQSTHLVKIQIYSWVCTRRITTFPVLSSRSNSNILTLLPAFKSLLSSLERFAFDKDWRSVLSNSRRAPVVRCRDDVDVVVDVGASGSRPRVFFNSFSNRSFVVSTTSEVIFVMAKKNSDKLLKITRTYTRFFIFIYRRHNFNLVYFIVIYASK